MRWTESDDECAQFLQHCGLTNADIGKILKRPTSDVAARLRAVRTYKPPRGYREQMARTWGQIADNFATIGNA